MKTILMSIRPQWVYKIFTGQKTIELRKTAPKPAFRVVMYCTQGEPLLYRSEATKGLYLTNNGKEKALAANGHTVLNGKAIGEFICDRVHDIYEPYLTWLEEQSCVDMNEIAAYKGDRDCIYGLHITAPKLYDKPLVLEKRPPQSWQYLIDPEDN